MVLNDERVQAAYTKAQESLEELSQILREMTAATIDADYEFKGPSETSHSLSSLFGDRRDLLVIHNMGRQCRWCTLWADGLNGLHDHILARTAVVLVSPDSPEVQAEFGQSRNWTIPMYSDESGAFTNDMGFAIVQDGKRYVMPGVSAFHKDDDGTIRRVACDGFGPGDVYMPVYPLFKLLQDGAADWEPQYKYNKPVSIDL